MKRIVLAGLLGACTGPNYQPTQLPWNTHAVAVGGTHAIVLTEVDGTIDAGTVETSGPAIDLPLDPNSNEPVALDLPVATALAVGERHACIISAAQVSCWGDNDAGALGAQRACSAQGNSGESDCVLAPDIMPTLPPIRAIAAGTDFTCATTMDGTVMCWGQNANGELANSQVSALDPPKPIMLPDGKPLYVDRVIAAESTACAIDRTQSAWCWGRGYGPAPTRLPYSGVADIEVNTDHGCVIASDGLTCWGNNINGQIDAPTARTCAQGAECALGPTKIAIAAQRVAVGARHTCVLDTNGDVTCFGSNEHGQLARSDAFLVGDPAVAFSGATDLVAGETHNCVLAPGQQAWCWGDQW
jgi:alpha-tubulin suppressor-like RCC1 family protein